VNRQIILTNIANNKDYLHYCKKLCKLNKSFIHEDLYQEFLLAICETDEDVLIKLSNDNQINLYCLGVIFRINGMRIRPAVFNPCKHPLYELNRNTEEINKHTNNDYYNINIDINATKVLDYVSKDKTIKVEDWLLLVESLDRKLIDISKESGIPYITLKVKSKRLKDKIRNNVNI